MTKIQLRHDTAANFASENPILLAGEAAIETDTNKMKIGDGTTAYNSLDYFGGEAPDLSNYYNKTQTDGLLDEKQDILTPNDPLSISTYAVSNLEGMQYTQDGTGFYTTGAYWSTFDVYNLTTSQGPLAGTTLNPDTFKNRVMIPYTFGQIVKLPSDYTRATMDDGYSPFLLGKLLSDGTFIPIWQPITESRYLMSSDTPTSYSTTSIQLAHTDTYKQSPDVNERLATGGAENLTYILLQMELSGDNFVTNIMNYSPYLSREGMPSKGRFTFIDANHINRLKEINCIMICPTASYGANSTKAIPVSTIGLYANTGDLYNMVTSSNYRTIDLGENLFDLSGVQSHNYLDLHIGAGLAVRNGNLVNTNPTTPSIMTGATSSTAGAAGLVPAPAAGDDTKFLSGDGTYKTVSGGGGSGTVDQTYDPTSTNAQSGTAVAEAVSDCVQKDELVEVQVVVESSDISLLPSFYKVFSDGLCIQGGNCTSGTAVTFLKEFANVNYINTCSASASSTTGFTPSATGSYIVVGQVNLTTTNS